MQATLYTRAVRHYLPHQVCLLQNWQLIWVDVVSDQIIAISYYTIGALLLLLCIRPMKLARFIAYISLVGAWILRSGGISFGLFILSCGLTHQVDVVTIWSPIYFVDACIKVVTAILSGITTVGVLALARGFIHSEGGYRMFLRRFITGLNH